MLKRGSLAGLAGLLTIGLAAFGVSPAQAEDTDATATISGVVSVDDKPKAGMSVCVQTGDCALTADDGSYEVGISSIEGEYAILSLNLTAEQAALYFEPGKAGGLSRWYKVKSGDSLEGKNFNLVSFPLVTGRVLNESGNPVANATVDGGLETSTSDTNGAYQVLVQTYNEGGSIKVTAAGYKPSHLRISRAADGFAPLTGANVTLAAAATPKAAPVSAIAWTKPIIVGKAKVGKTLTAQAGVWGPVGVTLSYKWFRNGKLIKKATAATYKLTKKDRRKKISVKVIGSKAGCKSVAKKSAATKRVAKR